MGAIDAHNKWKIRLQNYVSGTSDENLIRWLFAEITCARWVNGFMGLHSSTFMTLPNFRSCGPIMRSSI